MATFYYFPTFHCLSSHRVLFSSQVSSPNFCIYHRYHKQCYSRFSASSFKKPRASKKGKSNADIFNDIREFLSTAGLPEDHVPSMKELSQHGRQDLANVVRRRGYKYITQLLESSTSTNFIESNIETDRTGKLEVLSGPEGQNEKLDVLANDALSSEVIQEGDRDGGELYLEEQSTFASDSTTISLQEKVAKFIKHGELDGIEDRDSLITDERCTDEGERNTESEVSHEPEFISSYQGHKDLLLFSSSGAETLNGHATPSSVQNFEHPVLGNNISRNSYISTEERIQMDHDKDLDVEEPKAENQAEVKRLKFMLHQKELELDRLKQQIEKEKVTLSVLQTKAETDINKAQKLITEMETELHAAEGSLSGLKEVELHYSGDGETVELAGSFNGWHHKIKMDPQPPSSSVGPSGSRKSRLWRTVLWLYPGIYEIKFVVDGHWKIDPQRESITRGTLHNNILQVN